MSPTLQSEFLTTGPQGKPWVSSLTRNPLLCSSCFSSTGSLGVPPGSPASEPLQVLLSPPRMCCPKISTYMAPSVSAHLSPCYGGGLPTQRPLLPLPFASVSCSSLSLTGLTVFSPVSVTGMEVCEVRSFLLHMNSIFRISE